MKALGIVFLIIGIVAVIGSLIFMFALATISAAAASLPPVEGVDTSTFLSSIQTVINAGWAWGIATLLSGLVSIRAGWREK